MLPSQKLQFYAQIAVYRQIIHDDHQKRSVDVDFLKENPIKVDEHFLRREAADFVRYVRLQHSDFEKGVSPPGDPPKPIVPIEFLPPPSKLASHDCPVFRPSNPESSKEAILQKSCTYKPSRKYFVPPVKVTLDTPFLLEFDPAPPSNEAEKYSEYMSKIPPSPSSEEETEGPSPISLHGISEASSCMYDLKLPEVTRLCELCFEFLNRKPAVWFEPSFRYCSNFSFLGDINKFNEFEALEKLMTQTLIISMEDLQDPELPEKYEMNGRRCSSRERFRKAKYHALSERVDILCRPPKD